jgi:hypothetical protein
MTKEYTIEDIDDCLEALKASKIEIPRIYFTEDVRHLAGNTNVPIYTAFIRAFDNCKKIHAGIVSELNMMRLELIANKESIEKELEKLEIYLDDVENNYYSIGGFLRDFLIKSLKDRILDIKKELAND